MFSQVLYFKQQGMKELTRSFLLCIVLYIFWKFKRVMKNAFDSIVSVNISKANSNVMTERNLYWWWVVSPASSVRKCMIGKSVSGTRCSFMVHVRSLLDWFITSSFQGLLRGDFWSSSFCSVHTSTWFGLLFSLQFIKTVDYKMTELSRAN